MKTLLNPLCATLLSLVLFASCSHEPKAIDYGHDACDFCRMTIVDKQHAAQIVTSKGKNYKYDAIECMVRDLKNWDRPEASQILVADYTNPGALTDAQNASYLITEKIPSPMGANLSAFSSDIQRNETYKSSGGDQLSWDQLKLRLAQKVSTNNR